MLKNITRSGGYAFVYYILGDLRWEGGAEVSDDEKSNIAKLIGQYYMRENLSALMILDHRKEAFVPISDSDKTVI